MATRFFDSPEIKKKKYFKKHSGSAITSDAMTWTPGKTLPLALSNFSAWNYLQNKNSPGIKEGNTDGHVRSYRFASFKYIFLEITLVLNIFFSIWRVDLTCDRWPAYPFVWILYCNFSIELRDPFPYDPLYTTLMLNFFFPFYLPPSKWDGSLIWPATIEGRFILYVVVSAISDTIFRPLSVLNINTFNREGKSPKYMIL